MLNLEKIYQVVIIKVVLCNYMFYEVVQNSEDLASSGLFWGGVI